MTERILRMRIELAREEAKAGMDEAYYLIGTMAAEDPRRAQVGAALGKLMEARDMLECAKACAESL